MIIESTVASVIGKAGAAAIGSAVEKAGVAAVAFAAEQCVEHIDDIACAGVEVVGCVAEAGLELVNDVVDGIFGIFR